MPLWGAYFFPIALSYFIIFFDVYWFYKSVHLVVMSFIAARKIRSAEHTDWLSRAEQLPNFSKIAHLIVIPSYKESYEKIKETLESIREQSFPKKQIYIYMAFEAREDNVSLKGDRLKKEYEQIFGGFYYTLHPDLPNEVKGKSSNQAYAASDAYKVLVKSGKLNINFMTVTSDDADVLFDKAFF